MITQDDIDAFSEFHPPLPEGKEHLKYVDFPKMPIALWEWTLEVLAPFELHVLSYATYDKLARGQIWVHPDGFKELSDVMDKNTQRLNEIFEEYNK